MKINSHTFGFSWYQTAHANVGRRMSHDCYITRMKAQRILDLENKAFLEKFQHQSLQ